jgi:hypothetical protein
MSPGNELDILIAEKVFGAERHPDFKHLISATPPVMGGLITLNTVPKYSADIAMAWEVVLFMRSKGFSFAVNMSDDWEVEFNLNDGRFLQNADTVGFGRGDTAPLAISLAALMAMGVEA